MDSGMGAVPAILPDRRNRTRPHRRVIGLTSLLESAGNQLAHEPRKTAVIGFMIA